MVRHSANDSAPSSVGLPVLPGGEEGYQTTKRSPPLPHDHHRSCWYEVVTLARQGCRKPTRFSRSLAGFLYFRHLFQSFAKHYHKKKRALRRAFLVGVLHMLVAEAKHTNQLVVGVVLLNLELNFNLERPCLGGRRILKGVTEEPNKVPHHGAQILLDLSDFRVAHNTLQRSGLLTIEKPPPLGRGLFSFCLKIRRTLSRGRGSKEVREYNLHTHTLTISYLIQPQTLDKNLYMCIFT